MRKYGNIALCVLLLALTACTSEDMERQTVADGTVRFAPQMMSDWNTPWTTRVAAENSTTVQALQGTDGLYLHTSVQRGIQRNEIITRGTKYIGIDDGNSGKTFSTTETFHVSGYRYAGNSNVSSVTGANFFNNDIVRSDHGVWKVNDQTYVMPAATDKIDFFAWFVADEETAGVSAINAAGGLQLSYTVPTNIDNQPDLLTAATREETFSADPEYVVPLSFAHQLTAVNFVLDENVAPGQITEIAFMNVYTGGTLSIGEGISGTWSLTSAPTETTYTMNFETVDAGALRTGEPIIANLMMIPQTFSENQKIRIYMTIDGVDKTLFADLKETRWEPGTTVTYKISTSSVNTLRVSGLTYPTSWNEATGVKSKYAAGDEIGVFGVDADGHVIFANKKYTLNVNTNNNDSSWVADDGTKSLYVPGNTYYAYYPYQATLSGAPVESSETTILVNNALPTAAQFFSSVITNWTPAEDQSTAALLNAQDLQIGQSVPGVVSTVSFAMEHTMGLASINIPVSKNVSNLVYFEANGTTVSSSSTETTTVAPSTTISNYQLCNGSSANQQFMVVKPDNDYTFTPTTTDLYDSWDANVTANVAANAYTPYNVTNKVWTRNYVRRGWVFAYTGGAQTFTVPADGTYTFECWGAQGGGNTDYPGGKGAYVCGDISLTKSSDFYVYVGQTGNNVTGLTATNTTSVSIGAQSWNAGYPYDIIFNNGFKTYVLNGTWVCAGGGATDIRTVDGTWNEATGLSSRIMVAAGGAGSNFYNTKDRGGAAGAYIGYPGTSTGGDGDAATGGEQTQGGKHGTGQWSQWNTTYGLTTNGRAAFGQTKIYNVCCSGGGGGWYCGGNGNHGGGTTGGGAGGSSYISGHSGCTANATYSFSSTRMIDGMGKEWTNTTTSTQATTPAHTGFSAQEGHTGNGYARITSKVVE